MFCARCDVKDVLCNADSALRAIEEGGRCVPRWVFELLTPLTVASVEAVRYTLLAWLKVTGVGTMRRVDSVDSLHEGSPAQRSALRFMSLEVTTDKHSASLILPCTALHEPKANNTIEYVKSSVEVHSSREPHGSDAAIIYYIRFRTLYDSKDCLDN